MSEPVVRKWSDGWWFKTAGEVQIAEHNDAVDLVERMRPVVEAALAFAEFVRDDDDWLNKPAKKVIAAGRAYRDLDAKGEGK